MKESIKNNIKKLINGGYSIQWLNGQAHPYIQKLEEEEGITITTQIPNKNRLALESRAKEMFFDAVLKQKKYTFSYPLVVINPYRIAPLTAMVLFCTKSSCTVTCTVCGKNGGEDLVTKIRQPKTEHRIPIVGLYPGTVNKVILELTDAAGNKRRNRLSVKTFPVAKSFKDIVCVKCRKRKPSEEYIYVSGGFSAKSYIFDSKGNIRFYYNKGVKLYGTHMLSNGHLLFPECNISNPTFSNPHSTVFHELDFMGRVYRTFMVEKGVHHFASEKGEGGNLLLATSTLTEKFGMENAVLEINRYTGEVISLLELNKLFDDTYQTRHDWAHINSIQYLVDEDAVILSLRNIHSVVKVKWSTKELEWILANPKFWESTAMSDKVLNPQSEDIFWFYQQHAAEVLSSEKGCKHVLLYDNHIATRRPVEYFDSTEDSYLLIFKIDEQRRTVAMEKKFSTKKSLVRSNGALVKGKNRIFGMSASLYPRRGEYKGMVEEFDYGTGERLNEYALKNDFFSAYPVHFDAEEMSRPLDLQLPYEVGHVLQPERITREDAVKLGWREDAEPADNKIYKNYIYNRLLLIKETDNEIRNVYAVGNIYMYRLDKTSTYQKAPDTFGNTRYYITFPLENCEPDEYTFYLQTAEGVYKVGETVRMERR